MKYRLPIVVAALGLTLLVAGCSQQPALAPKIASLSSGSPSLTAAGGSDTPTWSGSNAADYTLTVSPTAGAKVNGTAYSGAVDLKTATRATVTLPSNSSSSRVGYTLTLTATGGPGTTATTKTATVTVATSPAVVYSGGAYGFSGPPGVAADAGVHIWVTNDSGNSVTEIRRGSGWCRLSRRSVAWASPERPRANRATRERARIGSGALSPWTVWAGMRPRSGGPRAPDRS